MRTSLSVHSLAVLVAALCATTSMAADPLGEKATLQVHVLSGDPPMPILNAAVSVKGSDGRELADAKRSDTHGDVHFLDLPRVEMMIVIVANGYKTFKALRSVDQPQDPLTVLLERLDQ